MNFVHSDLGQVAPGGVVVVTLGSAANVRLLDETNFRSYRARGSYRGYHMGFYRQSPVRLRVPYAGHWHVVVDLGGYSGTIRAGVQVLQPAS